MTIEFWILRYPWNMVNRYCYGSWWLNIYIYIHIRIVLYSDHELHVYIYIDMYNNCLTPTVFFRGTGFGFLETWVLFWSAFQVRTSSGNQRPKAISIGKTLWKFTIVDALPTIFSKPEIKVARCSQYIWQRNTSWNKTMVLMALWPGFATTFQSVNEIGRTWQWNISETLNR